MEKQIQDDLNHIFIAQPCPMQWEDMIQNGSGKRFCIGCAKNVYDLEGLNKANYDALYQKYGERLCVRVSENRISNGPIWNRTKLFAGHFTKVALVSFFTFLSWSTEVMAQTMNNINPKFSSSEGKENKKKRLKVILVDQNGKRLTYDYVQATIFLNDMYVDSKHLMFGDGSFSWPYPITESDSVRVEIHRYYDPKVHFKETTVIVSADELLAGIVKVAVKVIPKGGPFIRKFIGCPTPMGGRGRRISLCGTGKKQ